VRFSNIDESYGFDQLVTPPIGAADFLMGKITDLPLTNVVANTWIGGHLFPYTHANRAAAVLFKPRSFLQRLDSELEFDRPTFMVAHLCAAHWPYYVAGVPEDADQRTHEDDRPLYDIGLGTADEMFGEIVALLERKGALRNAIVVVLSDHGEALSMSGDSLLGEVQTDRVAGLRMPVNLMDWGHGQSVLSPVQFSVLLAFRSFGDGVQYRPSGRTLDAPATVLDIKPTLLDLLGLPGVEAGAYAQSLAPLLARDDAELAGRLHARPRFTETDLRVSVSQLGTVDEDAAARENSLYFAVDRETGRLELRPTAFPVLMEFKERAAILGPWLLAAVPADVAHHQYLLVDRHTGVGRMLEAAPQATDRDAFALWTALHAAYGEELRPPTVLDPQDMPEVTARWMDFLAAAQRSVRN
jgi:Sulfatase